MSDTITVRGFAGTSPDHKPTASGNKITTLRLGSTPRWRLAQTGEWAQGKTNWYTVAAFGRLAENVVTSIEKGDPIVVVGRPKVRQWENADGERGTHVEINAQSVAHDLTFGVTRFTKISAAPQLSEDQTEDGTDTQDLTHGPVPSPVADNLNGHSPETAPHTEGGPSSHTQVGAA